MTTDMSGEVSGAMSGRSAAASGRRAALTDHLEAGGSLARPGLRAAGLQIRHEALLPPARARLIAPAVAPTEGRRRLDGSRPDARAEWFDVAHEGDPVLLRGDCAGRDPHAREEVAA